MCRTIERRDAQSGRVSVPLVLATVAVIGALGFWLRTKEPLEERYAMSVVWSAVSTDASRPDIEEFLASEGLRSIAAEICLEIEPDLQPLVDQIRFGVEEFKEGEVRIEAHLPKYLKKNDVVLGINEQIRGRVLGYVYSELPR